MFKQILAISVSIFFLTAPMARAAATAALFDFDEKLENIEKMYMLMSDMNVLNQVRAGIRMGLVLNKVTFHTLRAGHVYRVIMQGGPDNPQAVASFNVTTFGTSSHPESIVGVGTLRPQTP